MGRAPWAQILPEGLEGSTGATLGTMDHSRIGHNPLFLGDPAWSFLKPFSALDLDVPSVPASPCSLALTAA